MHDMQDLLNLIKTSGMVSQKSSGKNTSVFQTTPTTDDFDWFDWYQSPGNSIRAYDEAHGIHVQRQDNGFTTLWAERDELLPKHEAIVTYPTYFQNRTFDRFSVSLYSLKSSEIASKALKLSRKYCENIDRIMAEMRGTGLYFVSKTKGSGKTYLCTILGNELTRRGKNVLWYSMPNLLQEIKSTYDRESGTTTGEFIDRIKNVEILILDDIGVEKQSSWVNEILFTILDHRMMLCRPTLFTSNYPPDELNYDERIIDRIRSITTPVPLPEENIRRRFAAQNDLNKFLEV